MHLNNVMGTKTHREARQVTLCCRFHVHKAYKTVYKWSGEVNIAYGSSKPSAWHSFAVSNTLCDGKPRKIFLLPEHTV